MNDEVILKNFSERLSSLIKESGTDINTLANKIGIKSKSTIYRYMNGEMAPKISTIRYLAEIFLVNPIWLMGYDVPKKRDELYNNNSKNPAVVFVYGTIPAGIPMECIEDIIDTEEISTDMLKCGKQYFGLKIKGNSMSPEYLDGDTIILEKVDDCESGQDCVVMVNGNDGTFKRVFKNETGIILQPLNPEFQPLIYTNEQIKSLPVRVIGKVVELRRKK